AKSAIWRVSPECDDGPSGVPPDGPRRFEGTPAPLSKTLKRGPCRAFWRGAPVSPEQLCQQFGLCFLELLSADRALVLQLAQLVQFVRGRAVGLFADVGVHVLLCLRLCLDRSVAHPLATGDQVDQRRYEGDEDEEEHPGSLCPA